MTTPHGGDDLLPAAVPKRLGRYSAVLVVAVLVGMVIAAVAGGVDWLIGIGGAGTAVGTLGLAYFTFTVAERTTELAGSSQRLEATTTQELTAGRAQADAAAAAAREAEKSRIDALAPIVDVRVDWLEGRGRQRGVTPRTTIVLANQPDYGVNPKDMDFDANLTVSFRNFGRTPAFATVKQFGAWFDDANAVIRIEPGGGRAFQARVVYADLSDDPFAAREIRYEVELWGAMTGETLDTIRWAGELTLLERGSRGWHRHPNPLVLKDYSVTRDHGLGA